MAADVTAVLKATTTLTAATKKIVRFTGKTRPMVELTHQGNVDNPVYFAVADEEADLPTTPTVGGAELEVLLAGERLTVDAPRRAAWIVLISAGTATVTLSTVS